LLVAINAENQLIHMLIVPMRPVICYLFNVKNAKTPSMAVVPKNARMLSIFPWKNKK
jgi:hypothetical protein